MVQLSQEVQNRIASPEYAQARKFVIEGKRYDPSSVVGRQIQFIYSVGGREAIFSSKFVPEGKTFVDDAKRDEFTVMVDGQGFSVAPQDREKFIQQQTIAGASKITSQGQTLYETPKQTQTMKTDILLSQSKPPITSQQLSPAQQKVTIQRSQQLGGIILTPEESKGFASNGDTVSQVRTTNQIFMESNIRETEKILGRDVGSSSVSYISAESIPRVGWVTAYKQVETTGSKFIGLGFLGTPAFVQASELPGIIGRSAQAGTMASAVYTKGDLQRSVIVGELRRQKVETIADFIIPQTPFQVAITAGSFGLSYAKVPKLTKSIVIGKQARKGRVITTELKYISSSGSKGVVRAETFTEKLGEKTIFGLTRTKGIGVKTIYNIPKAKVVYQLEKLSISTGAEASLTALGKTKTFAQVSLGGQLYQVPIKKALQLNLQRYGAVTYGFATRRGAIGLTLAKDYSGRSALSLGFIRSVSQPKLSLYVSKRGMAPLTRFVKPTREYIQPVFYTTGGISNIISPSYSSYKSLAGGVGLSKFYISPNLKLELPKFSTTVKTESLTGMKVMELPKQKSLQLPKTKTITETKYISKTITPTKTKVIPRQAQTLKSVQKTALVQKPITRVPVYTPRATPKPFGFVFKLPKTKTITPKKLKFPAFLRRFGKFKVVGYGRTPEEAFAIGKTAASKSLGATFKVPSYKGTKAKGFRTKKTKEGVEFIELPKFRLSTGSEKQEIKYFRELKGGRKSSGNKKLSKRTTSKKKRK